MSDGDGREPREPDHTRARATERDLAGPGHEPGPPRLRVVPGKATLTGKLAPRPGPMRTPREPGARPALSARRSLAELSDDPWMDAAHRGLTAVSERPGGEEIEASHGESSTDRSDP